jgi:hypothetical protein
MKTILITLNNKLFIIYYLLFIIYYLIYSHIFYAFFYRLIKVKNIKTLTEVV